MKPPAARKGAAARRLTHVIYEGLRDEITTGKLKPGEFLSRRQIASRYGSSSIPVIEAMVRLESAGLVEAETNQMARVRKISIETIQGDYVLREAIESQAIRLAAQGATDREIGELRELAETVEQRAADLDRGPDRKGLLLHWQFHKRIAELSRYPVLVRELERIELLERLQANWCHVADMADPPGWHLLLVDAIQGRNPEKAEAAMRAHVQLGLEKELKAYRIRASYS